MNNYIDNKDELNLIRCGYYQDEMNQGRRTEHIFPIFTPMIDLNQFGNQVPSNDQLELLHTVFKSRVSLINRSIGFKSTNKAYGYASLIIMYNEVCTTIETIRYWLSKIYNNPSLRNNYLLLVTLLKEYTELKQRMIEKLKVYTNTIKGYVETSVKKDKKELRQQIDHFGNPISQNEYDSKSIENSSYTLKQALKNLKDIEYPEIEEWQYR